MNDILKKPKTGLEPELLPEESNRMLTDEEKRKLEYSRTQLKAPVQNYIKESWSDIDAKNQPEPDDLMSIYKKYIKPPKENKETENSLRRLAIGEAISKGISGVGNMFSGKPTQFDSQPMSNTYLKSIEAADERRKRFDAQNHDYVGGMYNTAVDSWKYKKAGERQAAQDAESKRRFDIEAGLKDKAINERAIARQQKKDALKKQFEDKRKVIPVGATETVQAPDGTKFAAPKNSLKAVFTYALGRKFFKGDLTAELRALTTDADRENYMSARAIEAIQNDPEIADYAQDLALDWVTRLSSSGYNADGYKTKAKEENTQPISPSKRPVYDKNNKPTRAQSTII